MTVNDCSEFPTEDDPRRVSDTPLVNDSPDVCDIKKKQNWCSHVWKQHLVSLSASRVFVVRSVCGLTFSPQRFIWFQHRHVWQRRPKREINFWSISLSDIYWAGVMLYMKRWANVNVHGPASADRGRFLPPLNDNQHLDSIQALSRCFFVAR